MSAVPGVTLYNIGHLSLRGEVFPFSSVHAAAATVASGGPLPRIPLPAGMTPHEQRRMTRLTRISVYAAAQAWDTPECRGAPATIVTGLIHSSTSAVVSLHDALLEGGPDLVSPNAFSNATTNAGVSAIAPLTGSNGGGIPIAGGKGVGIEALACAAGRIAQGRCERCLVGCAEEYSTYSERVYRELGYCGDAVPPWLPCNETVHASPCSESALFCAVGPPVAGAGLARLDPLMAWGDCDVEVDAVISTAAGGRGDEGEFELLELLLRRQKRAPFVVFPAYRFGQTFAVSSLLCLAWAVQCLSDHSLCRTDPVHPQLRSLCAAHPPASPPRRLAVLCADPLVAGGMGVLVSRP